MADIKSEVEKEFDLGIACVQVYQNYGSAFTNFALYKYLLDAGLRVLLIEEPLSSDISPLSVRNFINYPFRESDCARIYRDKEDMRSLNRRCRAFLVGSDQLFNYEIYKRIDGFTKLDWVDDEIDKYCYATSLGVNRLLGPPEEQEDFIRSLKRFKAVSVREQGSRDLLNALGIEAACVLDPVFLCDGRHYIGMLAPYKDLAVGGYAFCYVLDPDGEKERIVKEAIGIIGCDHFTVSDMWRDEEDIKSLWNLPTHTHIKNEIWLANIYYSDFVVTDSYHALCFSLIFNKQFIILPNEKRGNERFESLLEITGLSERLISENASADEIKRLIAERIDYSAVAPIIEREREASENWIYENILRKQKNAP